MFFAAGKEAREGQRYLLKAILIALEEDPFLPACSPPPGTTRYAPCSLPDEHHLLVFLGWGPTFWLPSRRVWSWRRGQEQAEMLIIGGWCKMGITEVGGIFNYYLIWLERSWREISKCICIRIVLLCCVCIGVGNPQCWDLTEVLVDLVPSLAALETKIFVYLQAGWAAPPQGHFRGPQITQLPHYSHLFSLCRGEITRQRQLSAVSEDFHASLCPGLGWDEQKERQTSCACGDGSCSAGTAVLEKGGWL